MIHHSHILHALNYIPPTVAHTFNSMTALLSKNMTLNYNFMADTEIKLRGQQYFNDMVLLVFLVCGYVRFRRPVCGRIKRLYRFLTRSRKRSANSMVAQVLKDRMRKSPRSSRLSMTLYCAKSVAHKCLDVPQVTLALGNAMLYSLSQGGVTKFHIIAYRMYLDSLYKSYHPQSDAIEATCSALGALIAEDEESSIRMSINAFEMAVRVKGDSPDVVNEYYNALIGDGATNDNA